MRKVGCRDDHLARSRAIIATAVRMSTFLCFLSRPHFFTLVLSIRSLIGQVTTCSVKVQLLDLLDEEARLLESTPHISSCLPLCAIHVLDGRSVTVPLFLRVGLDAHGLGKEWL
jgi:hypothetical protein